MININKILDIPIKEDASDVHLIYGLKPMLRKLKKHSKK